MTSSWPLASLAALACACASAPPDPVRPQPPRPLAPAAALADRAPPPPIAAGPADRPAPAAADPPAPACRPLSVDPPALVARRGFDAPVPPIEGGESLAAFHDRLARLLRGLAADHVRLGVYGDSNLTRDLLTGYMRRTLQARNGDAGHGLVAVVRPWAWYHHLDVRHDAVEGSWQSYAISTHQVRDRAYGQSGVAGESRWKGAMTWVETAAEGAPVGTTASRADIYYLLQPEGGAFDVRVDGTDAGRVETDAPALGVRVRHLELVDAPHRVEIVAAGARRARVLGVALERDRPGLVVDSYGIGGASWFDLTRDNAAVTQAMLRLRPLDLVVLWLGTNLHAAERNATSVAAVVASRRAALPGLPVLIVSPPDHVVRAEDAVSDRQTVHEIEGLRDIARRNGCAFWDLRAAMGGEGSMARFYRAGLAAGDLFHLSETGSEWAASRLLRALWRDFEDHLARHPDAGCAARQPGP